MTMFLSFSTMNEFHAIKRELNEGKGQYVLLIEPFLRKKPFFWFMPGWSSCLAGLDKSED